MFFFVLSWLSGFWVLITKIRKAMGKSGGGGGGRAGGGGGRAVCSGRAMGGAKMSSSKPASSNAIKASSSKPTSAQAGSGNGLGLDETEAVKSFDGLGFCSVF